MADVQDTAREFLEQIGLEPTLNRMLVLSAITGSNHPLTAAEVHQKVLASHSLNRVTVYRILDLLAEHGAINKITAGERSFHYCANERKNFGHSHFHCTSCGEVTCIDNDAIDFNEQALSLPRGVSNVDLRLDGVCPVCRSKKEDH